MFHTGGNHNMSVSINGKSLALGTYERLKKCLLKKRCRHYYHLYFTGENLPKMSLLISEGEEYLPLLSPARVLYHYL